MADKKYVVMKWKDGWQEVVAVEGDVIGFDKYYVIERLENFGRLVFNRPKGEVPGLLVIDRDPRDIEQMVLMNETEDQRTLAFKDTYREGARLEYNYDLQNKGDFVTELTGKTKDALGKKGLSAKDMLLKGDPDIVALAKEINVVGGKSQQDLVQFMKILLRKIG